MEHKAGFVNIVGMPNVGKSTLMNALVGEKMSIVTPKEQTTRHRILGIVNGEDYQIVYSDTPGYINKPAYKMQEAMNAFVQQTFEDADLVLFMTDPFQKFESQELIFTLLAAVKTPILALINKIDVAKEEAVLELEQKMEGRIPYEEILKISAKEQIGTKELTETIVRFLPESPPYYEKDELTNRPLRFFIAEIIREKIFLHYRQEIPYSCDVGIETFKDEEQIIRIKALIFVNRKSQKSIVIGKAGSALKKVGTDARIDMEAYLGKKVFLELHVKVREKWRDNELMLKRLGYKQ